NGTSLKKEQICNFVKDCPSGLDELNCGSCDFESGLCGWANMTGKPQTWLLTTAKTASNSLAPKFDGSSHPNGHYLLMSKAQSGPDSRAEAILNYATPSMHLKSAYKTCVMTFDYFVHTDSQYWVDVRIGADTTNWNIIYRIEKVPNNGWRKAYAHIGIGFSPFMADLNGYLANSASG